MVGACAACGGSGEPAAAVSQLVRFWWFEGERALEAVARRVANLEALNAMETECAQVAYST
jgi:hypothetical protein